MTEAVKHEMRMPADEFDRIMRHALQAKPPAKPTKPQSKKRAKAKPRK
jgi:hypothetical protein